MENIKKKSIIQKINIWKFFSFWNKQNKLIKETGNVFKKLFFGTDKKVNKQRGIWEKKANKRKILKKKKKMKSASIFI